MAIKSQPAEVVFGYIVDDFESAWNSLVARPGYQEGGGNFMFALMSMILLEFACRVCFKDKSGEKLQELTNALKAIDPRYFTELGTPPIKNNNGEFTLPGAKPNPTLLGLLFELVRNGKAHQYQSAIAGLANDKCIDIDITGAASFRGLNYYGRTRPPEHLGFKISVDGDLSLYVRTDQLFLDFRQAIEDSGIITSRDRVTDIYRKWPRIDVAALQSKLSDAGHLRRDL
ncbi:MAG TPA: hypothetical protein VGK29_00190 [Paludibaculum sp.]|jgi:hypothetical protein